MPSERIQRQIDRFLDEADQAMAQSDWARVGDRADNVLALDPENADAQAYLAAAQRRLGEATPPPLPTAETARDAEKQQATSSAPSALSPQSSAPSPQSFAAGRYQVVRFLGEGGKKRVYLAHDTVLDRDVAFALIKPALSNVEGTEGLDQVGRERVLREAQAMGRLGAHPHIVSVFDLGEEASPASPSPYPSPSKGEGTAPSGQLFMVTELMAGGDVEAAIAQAPDHKLPLEQALTIAVQVCRGLEFAHGKGVIHRDLKPGNVWLTAPLDAAHPEPVEGRAAPGLGGAVAKIGDFGLAVALDRSRLTREGMMVGTVSYMPPEQALGGTPEFRSDLYSLGAMLYELACGRPPFVGDDSVAIIGQHLNTPPVSPSWHRPGLPPALETLILRLLEKDPARRPASAAEVRQTLESIDVGAGFIPPRDAMNGAPT
ncbi:MAG: serine/threonine protein kinase, partial [Chloroflexi bacterium]|nr:serine/threonine protein kinase [Chloroflexota bacterium]